MRLIDVDKIHPDVLSKKGLCITQNQLANALTIDAVPISVIEDIKSEIELIKKAEYQIYGKGSWNFVGKCLDVIDKHTSGAKMEEVEE